MKPIIVTAKKVKNGYLIPNGPELEDLSGSDIIVNNNTPALNKNSKVKKTAELKKNPADDKSYKEPAANAAVERYEKKAKNHIPSKLTDEQVKSFVKKYKVEDIHTTDDILLRKKNKKR